MKVAVATAFPADTTAPHGGVEAVSVNLVEALSAFDDLDLHVVTTDRQVRQPEERRWGRATIHRLPHSGARVLIDATGPGRRQLHAFLTRLAPAVVHSHDVFGLMVKGLPIPRVHTIHGFIHGDTLVSGERFAWLRSQLWRRIETSGWADQPHIISISPYVRERLTGIAKGMIHDVENPIAPRFFAIRRDERALTIFSAAVVCRRKNTLGLVNAFASVVRSGIDARLRLAGTVTEEEYGQAVRARVRELGLDSRVDWLGGLKVAAIERELAAASVFALVSREENAPLGIEEAMAAGVPVVTSNRCGMPYMVAHGETGFLVDPENAEDIARRLCELLADRHRRQTMGERAREIARARFHPSAVAARTRQVYFEATGRPAAALLPEAGYAPG
jgi:glycosyltransferase involved in cell wall biosynthesis